MNALRFEDVVRAGRRIRDGVVTTECSRSLGFPEADFGRVRFKTEFRQRTGSFKDRGALNRLLLLDPNERRVGVVAASAGNHAQALAHHAALLGIPCTIVMPEGAPLIKVTRTRAYGARVIQTGETLTDGLASVKRLVDREGLTQIPAFDDLRVMAGQGTMALEILDQTPDTDTVIVPVGGGGMISGVATVVKTLKPEARVIGVEAAASPGAVASLAAGKPVHLESSDTLADGIAVKRIGDLSFPIIRDLVDEMVVVDEEEIVRAIFFLMESEKMVVEGGGAVGVAALLTGKVRPKPEDDTVVVLSGGNIDMNVASKIIDRGLWADGRLTRLAVVVRDRPGYLHEVTAVVAIAGANVLHIEHTRTFGDITVGHVSVEMEIETRGRAHVAEILKEIKALGHRVREVA